MTAVAHDLVAAAHAVDSRRARSKQKQMGPSAVGGCRRRTAYDLAGVPRTDDEGPRMKAILGTWLHKGALDALRREYGALIELTVKSETMTGHVDAMYVEVDDPVTPTRISVLIEDVKTEGLYPFEWRETYGARVSHRFQVHLYAWHLREGWFPAKTRTKLVEAVLRQLDPSSPLTVTDVGELVVTAVTVDRVRLRYLCRDDGREWVDEAAYEPDITKAALEWIAEVYEALNDPKGPDAAPRDHDGPGLDVICDGCPFRTACWGPERADGMARQANLVRDDADVAEALADYDRGRALAKEGEEVKKLARAKLDAAEPGIYGPFKLGWSGGKGKKVDDLVAARAVFDELGLPFPQKVSGLGSYSIDVRKAPKPKENTDA